MNQAHNKTVACLTALVLCLWCFSFVNAEEAKTEWQTTLPQAGQSGVCVYGDNVYLTIHAPIKGEVNGLPKGKDIIGQCYSRDNGELKWEVKLSGTVEGSMLEAWHDATSLAPVANEKCIIFHNLNGMLLCSDHSGREIWKRAFDAPSPDIKNSRMFLHGDLLIVALPSQQIAVAGDAKHKPLPFYQIHGIDLATGKDRWISPVVQSHATQYSNVEWEGQSAIATSLIDLSHWRFNRGQRGYLLSINDGKPIHSFQIPKCIPHQRNQLIDGGFLIAHSKPGKTHFQTISPTDGTVRWETQFELPNKYFSWTGSKHELRPWGPKFESRNLGKRRYPTPSTMHVFGSRIFYFASASPSIGCVDFDNKQTTMIDVPVQVLKGGPIWDVKFRDFKEDVVDSIGRVVYRRSAKTGRGPHWGGFGHVNPAWPIQVGNKVYWQGGLGVLYRIDLEGEFSPNKVSWTGIANKGGDWTFGAPAVIRDEVYVRSQLQLVRLQWK